jgi:hypothetical protein
MGLPEDLQALQDLHEKGKLTDKEFADAKAATLRKHQEPTPAGRSSSSSIRPRIGVLLVILLAILGWFWYNAGTKRTTEMLATAVHAPIEVKNEVENLPATSWKGVALDLPYSGTVNVDVEVVRGNPIDVFLTTTDQLETMKKEQWNQLRVYTDFNASKTKTYRRSGQLSQGSYYLVLRDTSLGILSMSASDISVKVQLNP